uniref:2'-5' RNA ligase family protein n=1 Tax=Pseudonocardia sp. CA-138482 TaxID=3240023 RepID=UPI003F495837
MQHDRSSNLSGAGPVVNCASPDIPGARFNGRYGDHVRPYAFSFGDRPWPPDGAVLQVYMPVDLVTNRELAELIERWRAAVRGAPVAWLPDRMLHVTLDVVADATAEHISDRERGELADALAERLAGWPCYQGLAGSALAYPSGVVVDISPAGPLCALAGQVRAALRAVRGAAAVTWRQSKPHVSLGYAHAVADSDPWQRALRQIDPAHAPLRLAEVHLVEVHADPATARLEWESVAAIPLLSNPAERSPGRGAAR